MNRFNLTLLVVEDEALIAMELEDLLSDLGHRVAGVTASAGGALQFLSKTEADIDAVILDANLGGESALPVARTLTAERIPFVITSGYQTHELLRQDFEAPHVSKPYGPRDIDHALQKLWLQ